MPVKPSKTTQTRKDQILESAARLYSEKTYQATGMRELAEAVGIEPASIYSHFSSKEDVLEEIANRCADDFQTTVEPIFERSAPASERLREMIMAHIRVTLRNQSAAAIFDAEWRQLTEPRRSEYAKRRATYEKMFNDVLREGIEGGEFRQVGVRFATLTILSSLNFTYRWYREGGPLGPEEIGEQLATLLLNGLVVHS